MTFKKRYMIRYKHGCRKMDGRGWLSEEEAWGLCEASGWRYVDPAGLVWDMYYLEETWR